MGQNIITIKIGNKSRDIKVPRSWDDLDDRTALLYYNTLFTGIGDVRTQGVFTAVKLISLTQHILGFSMDMMAKWEASAASPPGPPDSSGQALSDGEGGRVSQGEGEMAFLDELKQVLTATLTMVEDGKPKGLFEVVETEDGGTGYAVLYNRTRNIWPVLASPPGPLSKGRGGEARRKSAAKWYYCAKDGLANITLYELAFTFSMYEAYLSGGDESFALKLIAALYRPSRPETREDRESDWKGDRRQPLRNYEGKVDERAKMVATLPVLTRRFIVFWFAGCREAIVQRYPRVFKKGGEGGAGRGGEWGKLLLTLAETGTFGELGQTSDTHFSNALEFMSMKDEQREEQEREMEAAKRRRK